MPIDLTTILAIWGAFLSSVLAGWTLYRDLTDRGKIRLYCYVGNIIGGPESSETDYLFWRVVNIGRGSVLVTSVGGALSEKNFMINPRTLPKMLVPGDYLSEYTDDLSILDKDLKYLCAWDSLGKVYKAPRKQLNRLKSGSEN